MAIRKPMPTKIACMVSVPRCASNSIRELLQLGGNRDDDAEEPGECRVIYENHQRLAVLERKYDLAGKYVFAFVRNPYERVASWYKCHSSLEPYASRSFARWVRDGCPSHWTIQNETNWTAAGLSPLLQGNFLAGGTPVDFVGRMENFGNDIRRLVHDLNRKCAEAGMDPRFVYRKVHINRSRPRAEPYSPELRAKVFELFRQDFEAFGYPA